jgi:hypothetical protein
LILGELTGDFSIRKGSTAFSALPGGLYYDSQRAMSGRLQ